MVMSSMKPSERQVSQKHKKFKFIPKSLKGLSSSINNSYVQKLVSKKKLDINVDLSLHKSE